MKNMAIAVMILMSLVTVSVFFFFFFFFYFITSPSALSSSFALLPLQCPLSLFQADVTLSHLTRLLAQHHCHPSTLNGGVVGVFSNN